MADKNKKLKIVTISMDESMTSADIEKKLTDNGFELAGVGMGTVEFEIKNRSLSEVDNLMRKLFGKMADDIEVFDASGNEIEESESERTKKARIKRGLTSQIKKEITGLTELSSDTVAHKLDISYDTAYYILHNFLDPIAKRGEKKRHLS